MNNEDRSTQEAVDSNSRGNLQEAFNAAAVQGSNSRLSWADRVEAEDDNKSDNDEVDEAETSNTSSNSRAENTTPLRTVSQSSEDMSGFTVVKTKSQKKRSKERKRAEALELAKTNPRHLRSRGDIRMN